MSVTVTFKYDPENPDDHAVGMTDDEYGQLLDQLIALGAYDVEVDRG